MQTVQPIASLYWRETPQNRALRAVLLVVAGVALLALSAKFKVPYYPVPMTLQTLVVLALAMSYGGALAVGTMVAYLAIGAAGAPVFAGAVGVAAFTGPTGGYLLGFLAATLFASFWARRGAGGRFATALACAVGADLLIFLCGVAQLAIIVGDLDKAVALGLTPFIIGDLSKAVLAAAAVVLASRLRAGDGSADGGNDSNANGS